MSCCSKRFFVRLFCSCGKELQFLLSRKVELLEISGEVPLGDGEIIKKRRRKHFIRCICGKLLAKVVK